MTDTVLAAIDEEIGRLQQVRMILASAGGGMKVKALKPGKVAKVKQKRKLSPEGRKRIAEAVKRRWAAKKKADKALAAAKA